MKSFLVLAVSSFVLLSLFVLFRIFYQPASQDSKSIDTHLKALSHQEVDLRSDKSDPNKVFNEEELKIKKNLDLYRKFMEKCFLKYYERQNGQVQSADFLVHFFTTKSGQLSEIEFIDDPYNDQSLTQCLREVLQRVKLKQKDQVLKVIFPIEVTWP